ncbi:integral membrane sensor signal transduction histidine kinase [Marinobacter manganoxydans MnI7-9]|uniref:histidine kinase n=1 Tax=Marinobacter manganoxydans MnI7-9 TaxID=1094979 RepID=G6YTE2_9GAMM|nr:integral membrane sensor signal transduction histidine kinase [Marinobacter manganoxydans MnI7-9]
MRNLSIGSRVALIAVLSSFLTVVVLSATAYNELIRDFENVLTQRQLLDAESIANRVDQDLQVRIQALGAFAATLTDGKNRLSKDRIEALLGRQSALSEYFEAGLLVFDEDSVAIAENVYVPNRIGTSYADRQHFREAYKTREPVISRPIIGRTTGLLLLSFLYPISSDDGDLLGFAGGIINLAEAGIIPKQEDASFGALFKVIDTGHFMQVDTLSVANPMPDLPPPGEDLIIDAALSGQTSGVVSDHSGKKWIYATQHLDRVGWMFLRAVPYQQATQPARASFDKFLAASAVALLALAAIAWLLARATTLPLERMSLRIREMATEGFAANRLSLKGPPEVRNVARAFNKLMKEREALDIMKDDFVSNVSHELRTPLTSINGALKLLRSGAAGKLPDKADSMVDVAFRNSEQLQRLISDLLDFNKAMAGQMPIDLETVDPATAIRDACDGNRAMASHYRIPLTLGHCTEKFVTADPTRLRQILDNFISNAIKFSPVGGSVRISSESTSSGMVRITVSDEGPGVPESFLPRLFQRFAQADSGSARSKAGTGLGLAICRELAKLMNCEVGYFYDNGANFWVELPQNMVSRNKVNESARNPPRGD